MTPVDLPELSRFLTEGFHTPADAAFARPAVLSWKFFEPRGCDAGDVTRSFVACDTGTGRIVGHLGLCPGRFRGLRLPADGVTTQHIIDWVTAGTGRGTGAKLMRRAHASTVTQYSLVLSAQARAVGLQAGYELIAMVPVMQRVTRVGFRFRGLSQRPLGCLLRAGRDVARNFIRPARPPRVAVDARQVECFGAEIQPILDAYQTRAVFFSRDTGMLNHLLRYPCGGLTGWHLTHNGALLGFAVLSLVSKPGDVFEGRIAGCMLATDDPHFWHAAMETLTRELNHQGADVVLAVASTDWTARALRSAGYSPAYRLDFRLRDRSRAVERGSVFHLTFMEADSAYT